MTNIVDNLEVVIFEINKNYQNKIDKNYYKLESIQPSADDSHLFTFYSQQAFNEFKTREPALYFYSNNIPQIKPIEQVEQIQKPQQMKKQINTIKKMIASICIPYFFISFYNLQPDCKMWHEGQRAGMLISSALIYLVLFLRSEDNKHK